MELVSLKTDEEISTLTIGDCFESGLTGAQYEITDLTRDSRSNRISSIQTKMVRGRTFATHIAPVSDGHWWSGSSVYFNFHSRGFKKVVSGKEYDPKQQPYTEDDI